MKLWSIEKNPNIKLNQEIGVYLSPNFIYLPLLSKGNKKRKVKKGESICGSVSSVSGFLCNVQKCDIVGKKDIPCVVIENDFQEKGIETPSRKKIVPLKKEEILESIFSSSLKEKMAISSFSTLIISGIDLEPFIANETFIQKEKVKSLLEAIDMLLQAYGGKKAIIAIRNVENDLIRIYNDFLGTYKKISLKMVPDRYLIGEKNFLIRYLHVREDYLYLKSSEVYSLYYQVKKRKIESEKYITFSGDFSNEIKVVLTKIGVKVKEVLEHFYSIDLSHYAIYLNGVMQGPLVSIENLIVTEDLIGLVIMKKQKEKVYACIRCGKCHQVCPLHSKPILAYEKGQKVPCLGCGLCSYVCPAHIPLRDYLEVRSDE